MVLYNVQNKGNKNENNYASKINSSRAAIIHRSPAHMSCQSKYTVDTSYLYTNSNDMCGCISALNEKGNSSEQSLHLLLEN